MSTTELAIERIGITPESLDELIVTEVQRGRMHALTTLDGRYNRYLNNGAKKDVIEGVEDLLKLPTSEFEWTKRRIQIEVEYAIALGDELHQNYEGPETKIIPRPFTGEEREVMRSLYKNFSEKDFQQIQTIDKKAKHDIVAMTRWMEYKLDKKGLNAKKLGLDVAIHFTRTSADINSNVYNTVVRDIVKEHYVPVVADFIELLTNLADDWGKSEEMEITFAGQTHGQFAEYTTVRKVFANWADTLRQGLEDGILKRNEKGEWEKFQFPGKIAGAVGNDDDILGAYPGHDWIGFNKKFVEETIGLPFTEMCDQDEFNVQNTKFYDAVVRLNELIIKTCDDAWEYFSRGVFSKKVTSEESGSSIMAQKANPWLLEGGWEFLDDAVGSFQKFHRLMQYKRQGDLRRSIRKRQIGVPFGETIIGMKRIMGELKKYGPNYNAIKKEIESHPGMLSAYIQTCLKREGIESAYDEIKKISMAKPVTIEDYKQKLDEFVEKDLLKKDVAERIKNGLDPDKRTGYATHLADKYLPIAKDFVAILRNAYGIK